MQRYTIFFIIADALHVSVGFSAHHQELKNYTHSIWYMPGLLLLLLSVAAVVLKRYTNDARSHEHQTESIFLQA
jgi:hypothetical protein